MNLSDIANTITTTSDSAGWWDGERNFGELIALCHSELSEALDAHRSGEAAFYGYCPETGDTFDTDDLVVDDETYRLAHIDDTPDDPGAPIKPEGWAVEIVDCIIRCIDLLEHESGYSVERLIILKDAYNKTRPRKHGKDY